MSHDPAAPEQTVAVADRWRSPGQTLVEVLRYRADLHDRELLFGFLDAELRLDESLTYRSLLRRATAFARLLLADGLTGECLLLAYPQGPEFIVALFAANIAGAIPVPVKFPRREEEITRFAQMAADAEATTVLLPEGQRAAFARLRSGRHLAQLRLLSEPADSEQADGAAAWVPVRPDDVALLQYTSGSTNAPKGIQVTHANLLANLECIRTGFRNERGTISLSWLPMFHDMGLIGHVLEPLYVGFPAYFLNPTLVVQEPGRWLRAVSRFRVTATGGPNFGYELCLKRPPRDEAEPLDLSTWKVAYTGSEPVLAETIERFSRRFAAAAFSPRAFYPCYGLAEATLIVTGGQPGDDIRTVSVDAGELAQGRVVHSAGSASARRLVACGPPRPGVGLAIVNPETGRPAAEGQVGEIWVAGPTVAAGYLNQPEESRRVFGARLPGRPPTAFLRTGDLGFMAGGQLFVVGRLHDMIIIRGRNLYPEDIETMVMTVCAAWDPVGCAVFAGGDPAEVAVQDIVIALELVQQPDHGELTARVREQTAAGYGVAVRDIVTVDRGRLPRTSSGKIRRSECARRYRAGTLGLAPTARPAQQNHTP